MNFQLHFLWRAFLLFISRGSINISITMVCSTSLSSQDFPAFLLLPNHLHNFQCTQFSFKMSTKGWMALESNRNLSIWLWVFEGILDGVLDYSLGLSANLMLKSIIMAHFLNRPTTPSLPPHQASVIKIWIIFGKTHAHDHLKDEEAEQICTIIKINAFNGQ